MNTDQLTNDALHMNTHGHAKSKFTNTDYLLELSDGNTEFIKAILASFKEQATRSLASFQIQLVNCDFLTVEKTAHAMKPTGVYVGSNSLTLLLGLLENAARNLNGTEVGRLIPQIQSLTKNILEEIDDYSK